MPEVYRDVWEALDLPDADDLRVKSNLAIAVERSMARLEISQKEAARRAHVSEADISNIIRGRFRGYSIARIQRVAQALGNDITMEVTPTADRRPGTVAVRLSDATGTGN